MKIMEDGGLFLWNFSKRLKDFKLGDSKAYNYKALRRLPIDSVFVLPLSFFVQEFIVKDQVLQHVKRTIFCNSLKS